MTAIVRAREWTGQRFTSDQKRDLCAYEVEDAMGSLTLSIHDRGSCANIGIGIDLTPRQALELAEHLLAFAVRNAQ